MYANHGRELPCQAKLVTNKDNAKAYGMILKDMFLNMDYDTNAKYHEIFLDTERRIDSRSEICLPSDFSKFLIGCVDVDSLINKRKGNAKKLIAALEKMGISPVRDFKKNECPLVVPIRVKNRDNFRKYLMDNRIYCAVHWPVGEFKTNERKQAVHNAETLISLPVDQRYGEEEMEYMIDTIRRYGGELTY